MTFDEAMAAVKDGKKVAISDWKPHNRWLALGDPNIIPFEVSTLPNVPLLAMYGDQGNIVNGYPLAPAELNAEDWEIIG
jgi:hypothetical protein